MTQAERDEIRALVLSFSTKISDLPEVEALQDGDYVVVVQNDGSKKHSKKATLESLLELIKIYYPDHNGAKYQGVAHPNDNIVNLPIGTDGFWFAIDAGVYTNYGGIVVGNSPKTLLYNAETHEWTSEDLWGDINGTVGFRLIDSSIENSLETFRIPVIQSRPYIISANARPSGSFAVLNIYEYDYTGELIGSIGYHVPEHSFTPREGTAYIKIGLGYNSSNPIAVELSEVRVTSSIKTLIEGLTDFVVDVLQGEYATHFGNIEDNINAILDRVEANEVNIATLQQGVSELGTGLDSLSSRTGIIAGDVAQLVIDTSGISTRLENTEQDVHELSITAGGLDERITNNQNDIFSLSTRADGLEVEVQNANRDITSLQITAEGLDARISNAQGDVDELEITAEGLRQRVSNAEGDIHTLESTATTLESNIGAVDGRVSTLSQTVERIDAKVENNEGEIAGLAVEAHRIDLYAQSVNTNLGNYEAYANGVMAGLQEQLDGAIDTYFYDYMPVHVDATGAPDSQVPLIEVTVGGVTIPCEPYASWYAIDEGGTAQEVNTERLKHLGDVFYDNKSGYAFRFSNTGTADSPIFAWAVITDSAVIRALADAARAQDTADHKRRVFVYSSSYPTPYAPYDVGDLWVKPVTVGTGASAQSTTELYRCKTAREKTTNTFPFNPAVNTDTTSSGCDWEIADGYGTIVNKANLEILSDAIIGSVTQTTFDYENGIITSQCSSTIKQTANEIKLAISNSAIDTAVAANGKINKPLLDTGIDITNGNIVLTANHIALKNQNNQTALELITVGSGQDTKVLIDVGSLNVSGIFSTTAWSNEETALHGYSDTAAGNAYTNAVAQAATDAASYITTNVSPLITNAQTTADNAATAAGNAQTTANNAATAAGNAQTAVNGMAYLATALANGTTAIGGGLVLSSLIGVGGNTGTDDAWELWGGIRALSSGEANTGIAAWYGGDAVDCTTISGWGSMTAAQKEQAWSTYRYARSLFRHDGSGYLASGEIAWGKNGDIVLHGVGIETPVISGGSIGSTTEVTDGTTTFTVADLIELKSWFQKDTYTDGTGTHTYLRLVCSPGTIEGFAADGFISAGGISPGGGGSGIDEPAMWAALQRNSGDGLDKQIHNAHLPTPGTGLSYTTDNSGIATAIGIASGYKLPTTTEWSNKADVSALAGYLPLSAGSGKALTGDLYLGAHSIANVDSITVSGLISWGATDQTTWNISNTGIRVLNSVNSAVTGAPYQYTVGLHVSGYYGFQLAAGVTNDLWLRTLGHENGSRQDWVRVYHSGNVDQFFRSRGKVANSSASANDLRLGTWFNNVSTTNFPYQYGVLFAFDGAVSDSTYDGYYVAQLYQSAAADNTLWYRSKRGTTWGSWVSIWHTGNSGTSTTSWTCADADVYGNVRFKAIGTGTYNIGFLGQSSSSCYFELPLATDSATGTKIPFCITWRGGGTYPFYISASDRVGIGTNDPEQKLDVSGSAAFGTTSGCGLYLRRGDANYFTASATGGFFIWQVNGSSTQSMRLNTSGNLTIGTGDSAGTTYKLYVDGSLNATTIYQNGTTLANTYLALSGGTLTGTGGVTLYINSTHSGQTALNIQRSGTSKTQLGYWDSDGTVLYDYPTGKYVNIASDGVFKYNNAYPFYHSGNSNKRNVSWSCSVLNVNRNESTGAMASSGTALEVQGYASYVAFKTYKADGSGSSTQVSGNHLVLDNQGYVGIGTASPDSKLHIVGAANAWTTHFQGSGSVMQISMCYPNIGAIITSSRNESTDTLLNVRNTVSSTVTSVLYVRGDGNVGIGTTSPATKFQVYNGDTIFGNSSSAGGRVKIVGVDSTSSNYALTAYNSAGTGLFYVRNDGNVGIGTNSPASTLDVNGNITLGTNYLVFTKNDSTTWATVQNSGLRVLNSISSSVTGAPGQYWTGLSIWGYYGFQLASNSNTNTFKMRGSSAAEGTYASWVTLYHSGNSNKSDVAWTCSSAYVYGNVDFLASGTGTYNRAQVSVNTSRMYLELPKATDSATGTNVPFYICWRGGGTRAIYINPTGYVGICKASNATPSQALDVTGNIVASGAVTAGSASDERLKYNIKTMTDADAMKFVMALRPVTFTWNAKATSLYDKYVGDDSGFIAQEVQPLMPKAVSPIFEEYLRIQPEKFVAPLVKVAQNHEQRIQELERENRKLKMEIERLRMN